MDSAQPTGAKPVADEFRHRNDELFARRAKLQQRLEELRAAADSGELDMVSELALRRTERESEELTHEIMVANYGLGRLLQFRLTRLPQRLLGRLGGRQEGVM